MQLYSQSVKASVLVGIWLFFSGVFSVGMAQLKSEGPYCAKWINSDPANGGGLAWGNVSAARCDENAASASAGVITGYNFTQFLRSNNFEFQIPETATITGIEVVIIRRAEPGVDSSTTPDAPA